MPRWLNALLLAAVAAVPAPAHFVWILPPQGDDPARVVFSDVMGPDENVPVTKISRTKVRTADGTVLKMTEQDNAYLLPVDAGQTRTLHGECVYGVIAKGGEPFLLVYHPKAVFGGKTPDQRRAALQPDRAAALEILVVPSEGYGGYRGVVLANGKPAPKAEVVVALPGVKKKHETETDNGGGFAFPVPEEDGIVAIRARVIDEKAGTHDGQEYKTARHYATLTVPAAVIRSFNEPATGAGQADARPAADPAATQLLKDARQARMEWQDFPGFTADVEVNHNGKVSTGHVTVGPDGRVDAELDREELKVDVKSDNTDLKKWLRQEVGSVVSHRRSNAAGLDTPCAFGDDDAHNPLGRKVLVLNDELHSSYRIRDRQITEVNRSMGPVRFTITVLKNYRTPEDKFLPASYVVNTWSNKTGQLVSSSAHHDTWQRVGGFDLPKSVLIVTAQGAGAADAAGPSLDAREIRFSNHRLRK